MLIGWRQPGYGVLGVAFDLLFMLRLEVKGDWSRKKVRRMRIKIIVETSMYDWFVLVKGFTPMKLRRCWGFINIMGVAYVSGL